MPFFTFHSSCAVLFHFQSLHVVWHHLLCFLLTCFVLFYAYTHKPTTIRAFVFFFSPFLNICRAYLYIFLIKHLPLLFQASHTHIYMYIYINSSFWQKPNGRNVLVFERIIMFGFYIHFDLCFSFTFVFVSVHCLLYGLVFLFVWEPPLCMRLYKVCF